MKNLMIVSALLTFFISTAIYLYSVNTVLANDWEVPPAVKRIQNPLSADDQQHIRAGSRLWRQHCRSCHGGEGKGDGSSARDLETTMRDFTQSEFQSQTDGEMFYKTAEGRDEMESFKGELSNNEIWQLVVFMRSLAN